jgi:hypothetical protein
MLLLLILPAAYGSCADVRAFFASLTSRWQSTRRSNVSIQKDLRSAGHYLPLCHGLGNDG